MEEFKKTVVACGLDDLGFTGQKYMWSNNREGEACIWERIYRFLANSLWHQHFPKTHVSHGLASYYDHLPIWLELEHYRRTTLKN